MTKIVVGLAVPKAESHARRDRLEILRSGVGICQVAAAEKYFVAASCGGGNQDSVTAGLPRLPVKKRTR